MGTMDEKIHLQAPVCPVPIANNEQIVLAHGSGGRLTSELIQRLFYPPFANPGLLQGNDSAVMPFTEGARVAITTDSHIVEPLFFPGGDIGRLAICGTVNDLAMVGARPLWLTAGFILEEGLSLDRLKAIVGSMAEVAEEAGVKIIAGDTKVVERGGADQIFINTCGVGVVPEGRDVGGANAKDGDVVLLSGPIADHGMAVLGARGEFEFKPPIESDVAPLNHMVEGMFSVSPEIHVLRDPTRGGLASALNEIAVQSGVGITLEEGAVPVRPSVQSACELLGFDPLYLANEGKLIAILPESHAPAVLDAMRKISYGEGACLIGRVSADPPGKVLIRTAIGGTRILDQLAGEIVPRIC
jgi:hydrogenase expression/formation protein HypE